MSIDDARAISHDEGRGSIALWFGILGSPLAWGGHLVLGYVLEEWFACSPSATNEGHVLGLPVGTVSVLLNTAMAVIAVAAGVASYVCWRRVGRSPDGDTWDRARWMAYVGIIESIVFTAAILLGYAPPLMLDACETAP